MGKQAHKTDNNMITTAIVWDHRGRAPEGGLGEVEIRLTIDRSPYYIQTGIKVRKQELVADHIVNCMGARQLNERLAILYGRVLDIVNDAIRDHVQISIEDVRRKVWQTSEEMSDGPTFLNWVEQQIPDLNIKESTRKHYWTTLDELREMCIIRRWQDITVENIYKFDTELHKKDIATSTIWNYHKNLKSLLNRAYSFGKIDENPYNRLRGKFDRGEKESVEYLTEDEMKRFMDLQLPAGSTLEKVKDLFVFQMFTGLSYSDLMAFNFEDYKWDGEKWRHTGERIKSGVPFVSTLLPPVVEVLEKYGWQVPKLNNADYNRHLKSLGLMAGIKTRMHTHLARHTFATYMLVEDAKFENVGKMLGHKNLKQTMRYAKVLAQSVHDDFDKVAEKLKKG